MMLNYGLLFLAFILGCLGLAGLFDHYVIHREERLIEKRDRKMKRQQKKSLIPYAQVNKSQSDQTRVSRAMTLAARFTDTH